VRGKRGGKLGREPLDLSLQLSHLGAELVNHRAFR
jgi:hypothetical protein